MTFFCPLFCLIPGKDFQHYLNQSSILILTTPFLLSKTCESTTLLTTKSKPPAQSEINTRPGAINASQEAGELRRILSCYGGIIIPITVVPKALVSILSGAIVILQPADWDKIANTDVSYLKFLQQCCFSMVSLFGLLGFPVLLLGWISVHRTHLEKAVWGKIERNTSRSWWKTFPSFVSMLWLGFFCPQMSR